MLSSKWLVSPVISSMATSDGSDLSVFPFSYRSGRGMAEGRGEGYSGYNSALYLRAWRPVSRVRSTS